MFIQKFQSFSASSGSRIAIRSQDRYLTYGELHAQAAGLAQQLHARGVRPGQLVLVFMPRSPASVAAMLAVMMSGAAYTVVEASGSPQEQLSRIAQIAPDLVIVAEELEPLAARSGLPYCLTGFEQTAAAPAALQALPAVSNDATAYVLFTSGSTGVPKGVAVSHGNLAHYCTGLIEKLGLPGGMTYAHVSTLSADLGNTSLFLSLWSGGTLYLAGEHERKDPLAMVTALQRHHVNVLKITPTHWRAILDTAQAAGAHAARLDWLILGGERLQTSLARKTLESGLARRLVNHYGPTETTIGVAIHPVALDSLCADDVASVPIGRPFGQTTVRIKTADDRLGTVGCEGELYIGGPSVAQGYRHQPETTRERFVSLERAGDRYYRTGDWVRSDAQGTLTFLGRVDRQVKVNGYRVELEHVERVLQTLPAIRQAVVVHHHHEDRDHLLCAYEGVAQPDAPLREEARQCLPGYMVPAVFLHHACLPTNANGKVDTLTLKRHLIEALLLKRAPRPAPGVAAPAGEDLRDALMRLFGQYVGTPEFSPDDNFFDLGADSLDAIQLISELQLKGYPATAHGFLACPSVTGLTAMITGHRKVFSSSLAEPKQAEPQQWPCSPAQQWFLEKGFAEPNRWTQAMVLELGVRLDPRLLEQAFERLVSEHGMLCASFQRDAAAQRWLFRTPSASAPVFSVYTAEPGLQTDLPACVKTRYHALESQLDIAAGHTFRAELLVCDDAHRLLLVGHHLVVDVISWRILLDDLIRHYAILNGDEPAADALKPGVFGNWCQHIEDHHGHLRSDADYWENQPRQALGPIAAGLEKHSGTAWITLTPTETEAFVKRAAAYGTSVDRLLLACFFEQCADSPAAEVIQIDIESHGRLSLSPEIDVSRTVGWFTSTFPLAFALPEIHSGNLPAIVHERLGRLPNLGHGYARIRQAQCDSPSRYCFNFLGQQRLGLRNDWRMRPACIELPGLRGAGNDRVYDLKLTGKIIDGRLVIDLNFDASVRSGKAMAAFSQALKGRLAAASSRGEPHPGGWQIRGSNSSGVLWNVPAEVLSPTRTHALRPSYEQVFLTGATGFIGIHALRELLLNSDARIHCLVRDLGTGRLASRLFDAWSAFFPTGELEAWWPRISLLAGDIAQPRLGMGEAEWHRMTRSADAIYHFAADTRLVGSRSEMESSILCPTEEIIRLAEQGRSKDLHYVSTLAVSGIYPGKRPLSFDEDSLDSGQAFQNEYERTKFDAEVLVRGFAYRGHNAFVYRSGNVTGNSRTGAFQRNAAANRWVQCLRAIVALEQAPRVYDEQIVLSAVDLVARGIVAISLDRGIPGGTFHVDSDYAVPARLFIDAIETLGTSIERVDCASLEDLFRQSGRLDNVDVALGYFWSARRYRNVRYDNRRTLALLARAGIAFKPLDRAWVTRFVARLQQSGVLEIGKRANPHARRAEFVSHEAD
jgi:amino acid adenylation domain-containing protein/thioester reductase-like protein